MPILLEVSRLGNGDKVKTNSQLLLLFLISVKSKSAGVVTDPKPGVRLMVSVFQTQRHVIFLS